MSYKILFNQYEITNHTSYTILVLPHNGEGKWTFQRRYSVVRAFHQQLLAQFKQVLPPFPPKKCCGNLNPEFIETRREALTQYFAALESLSVITESRMFKSFMKPDDKVMCETPKVEPKPGVKMESKEQLKVLYREIMDESCSGLMVVKPRNWLDDYEEEEGDSRYVLYSSTFETQNSLCLTPVPPLSPADRELSRDWLDSLFSKLLDVTTTSISTEENLVTPVK